MKGFIYKAKTDLRMALWKYSPYVYHRLVSQARFQHFSIGIFSGSNIYGLANADPTGKPVLSASDVDDIPATFVADPFMVRFEDQWFMFFEVFNSATRNGEIAYATSLNGLKWTYAKSVLREQFHVAYPQVFKFENEFYMIPDTPFAGVRLYRAKAFPNQWEFQHTALNGGFFSDSSVFFYANRWWLFTSWRAEKGHACSLRLFYSSNPLENWQEHPLSPVVEMDNVIARSAGRVWTNNNEIVRFSQDCSEQYGLLVNAHVIEEITPDSYAERPVDSGYVLERGSNQWNKDGMHHLDAHLLKDGSVLACVDGWTWSD